MISVLCYVPVHYTFANIQTYNCEAWQGALDKGLTNPRSISSMNVIEAKPLYEKRVFP